MKTPFLGEITSFYENKAPDKLRKILDKKYNREILDSSYPYSKRLGKGEYKESMDRLQIELVKLQADLHNSNNRIVLIFEGRDSAGKGGAISRLTQNLNPRLAPIVALAKPSDIEAEQWYFQRYIKELPSAGKMTIFDRSWYNRGVVEKVFGFCSQEQREHFFKQLPKFEQMLVEDGIHFIKYWLTVGQAEQLKRMLQREQDPLRQWKLSWVDVKGLEKWDEYTEAVNETLSQSNNPPWTIILADDKRRARLAVIQKLLLTYPYKGRDLKAIGPIDTQICGGLELRNEYRSL